MTDIEHNTLFKASADCVIRDLAGEIILLNLRNGTYYGLDITATMIWRKLENGIDFATLVTELRAVSDADAETIEADVRAFLSDLLDNDLVDICSGEPG